jgi:two-component system nitrate/nitrite response regulator NarL
LLHPYRWSISGKNVHRILVAEDDEAFLEALTAVLERDRSLEVVGRARNGREAVDLAEELRPDLVVMDIEMPVLDGVQATRLLRERLPDVPVLAISGHDYEERVLEIRAAGAADYVRKARLEDELPAVAAKLAAGQRSRR